MNILVIEDNELKFKQIEESLNRVLDCPNIVCMGSRNSGLVSLLVRNVKGKLEPYDLVITDNYLPLDDIDDNDMFGCEGDVLPFAKDIVDEIRRMGLEDLPIVVCSSDDIEECDFNYRIKYNASVSLDKIFQEILTDMSAYKKFREREEIKDCRSFRNMSCKVENSKKTVEDCIGYIHNDKKIDVSRKKDIIITKPSNEKIDYTGIVGKATLIHRTEINDSCSNYDPIGLCNILDCLCCDNSAYMIKLESGEGIIRSNKDIYSYSSEHQNGMTDDEHEILFYDRIPTEDELFSYLFEEDSKYRIIRKSDNEIMVDTTKQEIKGPVKKIKYKGD